tara:strand:+ start:55678 stop:57318 length:1641 start_codon:yes stop_codon:yes gene_type:complete
MSEKDNQNSGNEELDDARKAELDKMAEEIAIEASVEKGKVSTGNPKIDEILNETKKNSSTEQVSLNENTDSVNSNTDDDLVKADITGDDVPSYLSEQVPLDEYEGYEVDIDGPEIVTDDEAHGGLRKDTPHKVNDTNSETQINIGDEEHENLTNDAADYDLSATDSQQEIVIDDETHDNTANGATAYEFSAEDEQPEINIDDNENDNSTDGATAYEFSATDEQPEINIDDNENVNSTDGATAYEFSATGEQPEINIDDDDEYLSNDATAHDFSANYDEPQINIDGGNSDDELNFTVNDDLEDKAFESDFTKQASVGVADEEQEDEPDDKSKAPENLEQVLASLQAANSSNELGSQQVAQPTQNLNQQQPVSSQNSSSALNSMFGSLKGLFKNRQDANQKSNSSFIQYQEAKAFDDVFRLGRLQKEHMLLSEKAIKLTNPENYDPANKEEVLSIISDIAKATSVIQSQMSHVSLSTSGMKEQGLAFEEGADKFQKTSNKLTGELEGNIKELKDDNLSAAMEKLSKAIREMIEKIFKKDAPNNELSIS